MNALILAAQAAAQRREAAARYGSAPNVGTGGMDLGATDSSHMRRASRYARGKRSPGGYLKFVQGDDALPRDARPMRGWHSEHDSPLTSANSIHSPFLKRILRHISLSMLESIIEVGRGVSLRLADLDPPQNTLLHAIVPPLASRLRSSVARGEVLLLGVGYGVHLTSDGLVALNAQGIAVQGMYTDWHAWSDCPLAIDNVYQATKDTAEAFWRTPDVTVYVDALDHRELFHAIMGSLDIRLSSQQTYTDLKTGVSERITWQAETSVGRIDVYAYAFPTHPIHPDFVPNIVHEYGHVFNNRVEGQFSRELGIRLSAAKLLYSGLGWGTEQKETDPIIRQNTSHLLIEEQADMFLHWVYDLPGNGFDNTDAGNTRREIMFIVMPRFIIVAYAHDLNDQERRMLFVHHVKQITSNLPERQALEEEFINMSSSAVSAKIIADPAANVRPWPVADRDYPTPAGNIPHSALENGHLISVIGRIETENNEEWYLIFYDGYRLGWVHHSLVSGINAPTSLPMLDPQSAFIQGLTEW